MKIGILSQDIKLYSTKRLYETAKKRGHDPQVISYLRCYMSMAKGKPRIFQAGNELNFDSVIPRIAASWTFYGAAVVRQFELMGSLSANSSASINRSRDKLRALQLIGNTGVDMPITGYVHFSRDVESVLRTIGEPPFVIKLLEGTQGRGVVLTETMDAAISVIETMKKIDANILVQEFISDAVSIPSNPGEELTSKTRGPLSDWIKSTPATCKPNTCAALTALCSSISVIS